jgi:hypothetical protein
MRYWAKHGNEIVLKRDLGSFAVRFGYKLDTMWLNRDPELLLIRPWLSTPR